ncbi:RING-14 protein [Blumeria hordei DH14]|uniref:RING-14 protein n=1 Tax=Blumeria graminis f. sp. hordei (strain DH14) TaxID=546991 RepID=N1JIY0_BLUG1|nr:RING-14 protein [Blumeria hordei DH14]
MKFAHEFQLALEREGFPAFWIASAVPYSQLKKFLKNIQKEFQRLGLDPATLAQLSLQCKQEFSNTTESTSIVLPDKFKNYVALTPRITFSINLREDIHPDAALSPTITRFLGNLALDFSNPKKYLRKTEFSSIIQKQGEKFQQFKLPLKFEVQFIDVLRNDVVLLDLLQDQQQKSLIYQVETLSAAISSLTKPSKFHKTDMYTWRAIFDLYIQAGIFFSTHEHDRGTRDSATAQRQLEWFQIELMRRGLENLFKLRASRQTLNHFLALNLSLLQTLKFQEINQKAIYKIVKKFIKRTRLDIAKPIPRLVHPDTSISESIAKAICSKVNQDLIRIVPQIDDFICPVCLSVVWRPVKLKCHHIFCIQCTVLLQRERKWPCPLCRQNVVMEASQDNIDHKLDIFLRKHFPKEVRLKRIAAETADGIEKFGIYYRHPSEGRCCIM